MTIKNPTPRSRITLPYLGSITKARGWNRTVLASFFAIPIMFIAIFFISDRKVSAQSTEFGPPVTFGEPTQIWENVAGKIFIEDFDKDGKADIYTAWDCGPIVFWGPFRAFEFTFIDCNNSPDFAWNDFMMKGNFIESNSGTEIVHLESDPNGINPSSIYTTAQAELLKGGPEIGVFSFYQVGVASNVTVPPWFAAEYGYPDVVTDTEAVDFNRDGHLDLAATTVRNELWLFAGNGAGSFSEPEILTLAPGAKATDVGDFNGDGHADVVTANSTANSVSILFSLPSAPYFGNRTDIPVGTLPESIAAADFNGDGKSDFVTANNSDITISLSTSTSARQTSTIGSGGTGPSGVGVGDINLDGKMDFAVANYLSSTVSVFLGNSNGNFSPPSIAPAPVLPPSWDYGNTTTGLTIGDLTNDGKADIAFRGNESALINTGVYQTALTSTGSDVSVQTTGGTLTFENVAAAGTTTVAPIDAATVGDVPGGFAVSNIAFEISTTATFSGNVTSCFTVSNVDSETDFLALRVLHNEGGALVDRTSSHDYANRQICATTTSFSPFYLAKVGTALNTSLTEQKHLSQEARSL